MNPPTHEKYGQVGNRQHFARIVPVQNTVEVRGQLPGSQAWAEDSSKASPDSCPSAFFERSRLVVFFYCVRGLALPERVSLRHWKQFGPAEICILCYFCALNLLRIAAVIPFLVNLDAVLEKQVPSGNVFKKVYLSFAYFIGPTIVLGNMVCTWKRRATFREWHAATGANSALLSEVANAFPLKQAFTYNLAQGLLLASWANVLLFFRRSKQVEPFYASLLTSLSYFEVTYHCDLTPLMLMHLSQIFDNLAKEAGELLLVSDELRPNRHGNKEILSHLCRKWLALKRLAEGLGETASLVWLPFLLWATMSISFKVFEVSQKAPNGLEGWLYALFSIACRAIFMVVACNCGHSATYSARKFVKILSEFNSHNSATGPDKEDLEKETRRFLSTPDAHDGVVIALSGFCQLDRSIVGSILAMIITLYIALLQLEATR